ncbi:MAG: NYN domain-containing protein [Dehalococcoidia bacterium]|nr:NYN domain-containing protein [Dehalococcoidia bacterium]
MEERVAIFIDGSNFYHALKDNFGRADLDFEVFASRLCCERRLIRTYYYNVPVDQNREPQRYADQRKFFDRLHQTPYLTLKLGRLVYRGGVPIEKGVDVWLATDMLNLAWKNVYDTAIVVTGDGDFADAVEAVKELGKHVENAYTKKGLSQHLRQACDRLVVLDMDFLKECWLK